MFLLEIATAAVIGAAIGAMIIWRQWNVARSQNPPYCSVSSGVPGLRRVLVCKRPPKGDWCNDTPVIYERDWLKKGEQGDYYVYETRQVGTSEPRWAVMHS